MNVNAISLREFTLITAYAGFVVVCFGYLYFGFRRALAGAAVAAGVIMIGLLPSLAALLVLVAGFAGLVAVTTYYHNRASIFSTSPVLLLKQTMLGRTGQAMCGTVPNVPPESA